MLRVIIWVVLCFGYKLELYLVMMSLILIIFSILMLKHKKVNREFSLKVQLRTTACLFIHPKQNLARPATCLSVVNISGSMFE